MRYGEKLSELLVSRRLSQDELVSELGAIVSKSTVRRWIEGKSLPRLDEAIAVATYFNVSLESLAYDAYSKAVAVEEMPSEAEVFALSDDERVILAVYRDLGLDRPPVVMAMNALAKHQLVLPGDLVSSTGKQGQGQGHEPHRSGTVAMDGATRNPERKTR